MKKIAVIIPAYKVHRYIHDCITSVIRQNLPDGWTLEVRVGCDGCEQTKEALKNIHYQNVYYYHSENNVGAYVIRNTLIYLQYADIYALFDADDIMLSGYLYETIEKFEKEYKQFVMTSKYQCNNMMTTIRRISMQQGGAMSFDNTVLSALGSFHAVRCAADTDFMERAKNNGFEIYFIKKPLYKRRVHGNALTQAVKTCYGSDYRKTVWREMTDMRNRGLIYLEPEIIKFKAV